MNDVARDLAETAALVVLLRRSGARWPEIALEVLDSGSATATLRKSIAATADLLTEDSDGAQAVEVAEAEIRGWLDEGIQVLSCFDADYPAQLRDIKEMPPILFARGALSPDPRAVAVVGSRAASGRGLQIARTIASDLAHGGITVVSGLAKGIDTAAHTAALAAGGRTVAVIGTGIRHCYPAENRALQERISREGLLISQFWPEARPSKSSFPMRNAVMSGYAAMTVVVEAGERSGARIQARLALQHGRPVILTDQVMQYEWAQAFATRPGVHVVRTAVEMLDTVETILGQSAAPIDLEGHPDLAIC